jgi:hypothetical protein
LANGEIDAFRLQMDTASAAVNRTAVFLIDRDGALIETTLVPHGSPLSASLSGLDIGRDVNGILPFVTGVYTSPLTGKLGVPS